MEEIFSDLLDNIEQLHKQGLQALKEYKLKNPNWDKKNNRFLTLTILMFKRGGFLFKLSS